MALNKLHWCGGLMQNSLICVNTIQYVVANIHFAWLVSSHWMSHSCLLSIGTLQMCNYRQHLARAPSSFQRHAQGMHPLHVRYDTYALALFVCLCTYSCIPRPLHLRWRRSWSSGPPKMSWIYLTWNLTLRTRRTTDSSMCRLHQHLQRWSTLRMYSLLCTYPHFEIVSEVRSWNNLSLICIAMVQCIQYMYLKEWLCSLLCTLLNRGHACCVGEREGVRVGPVCGVGTGVSCVIKLHALLAN